MNNNVSFYVPELGKFNEGIDLDTPEFWNFDIKSNTYKAWLFQTFLRLNSLCKVSITDEFPTAGIIVLLADKVSRLMLLEKFKHLAEDAIVVIIRADELEFRHSLSDVEIVQNGKYANGKDILFIPHWPQPGIIKRQEDRGSKIQNIVFKGGHGSLDPVFFSRKWKDFLAKNGMNFILESENIGSTFNWTDYSSADIVLAVRPQFKDGGFRCDKPASKLINSWHAGVPSILGREYAYMELKKSELDYIEVTTVEEAMEAVLRLRSNPHLYSEMIRNGFERSIEYSFQSISNIWIDTLFNKIPKIRETRLYKASRNRKVEVRRLMNLVLKRQSLFECRKRLGYIYRYGEIV